MVTRWIFLFFPLSGILFSGEFTASVNRSRIQPGESFTLQLTLKETSAKGIPSLDVLKESFVIRSQQQSSNTVIVNGVASSSTTWKLVLTAQKEGESQIPAVSIYTSEGILESNPIVIQSVSGTTAGDSPTSNADDMYVTAQVSNASPYKNEPVVYTIKLTLKQPLSNIRLNPIELEDAVIEPIEEPKIYDKIVNGVRADVAEFNYLVTPTKAGRLKIPPAIVHGDVPIKRTFDNAFDPFFMMQGLSQLQPVVLTADETILDILPPPVEISPWLPARSLQIEEVLDESQPIREGEPFTRTVVIKAEGVKSGQLPSLQDLQIGNSPFKIYADNPERGDEVKNGRVKSFRKEQYTLIPQQSGSLSLPEISIAWWDVVKNEKRIARIPARRLDIAPATVSVVVSQDALNEETVSPVIPKQASQRDPLLYFIIAGLSVMLVGAVSFGVLLQKKIARLTGDAKISTKSESPARLRAIPIKKNPKKDKKEKLPDLNPT